MAKPANDLKKELRQHMADRYDAICFEPSGGRRGGVPFYRLYWPGRVLGIITPDEAQAVAGYETMGETLKAMTTTWTAGVPDEVFFMPGRSAVAFFEVKAGKDQLSPIQKLFLEIVRRLGYIAGEVSSTGDADRLIEDWWENRFYA